MWEELEVWFWWGNIKKLLFFISGANKPFIYKDESDFTVGDCSLFGLIKESPAFKSFEKTN